MSSSKLLDIYYICLGITVFVFFFAAYFIGTAICNAEESVCKSEEQEPCISFTVKPAAFSKAPEQQPLEGIEELLEQHEGGEGYYDIPLSRDRQDYVFSLCQSYRIPCELVFAIMSAESNFDEASVSRSSDYGVMQINSINHPWLSKELGVDDFNDFEQNVLCGVYMLSDYYMRYTDFNKIIMCYHYGEAGAKRLWSQGIYDTSYTRSIVVAIAGLKRVTA